MECEGLSHPLAPVASSRLSVLGPLTAILVLGFCLCPSGWGEWGHQQHPLIPHPDVTGCSHRILSTQVRCYVDCLIRSEKMKYNEGTAEQACSSRIGSWAAWQREAGELLRVQDTELALSQLTQRVERETSLQY